MWPLHTSEALAPLLVALAHIQVALTPISIYWNCGPLHMALALALAPGKLLLFRRLRGISICQKEPKIA